MEGIVPPLEKATIGATPRVVFCTTCKGRAQHIQRTLPGNLADNIDYPNCKFVLLDYNSGDHLLEYVKREHARQIESGRLVVYSYREPGPFRMAHAKNMAHRLGIIEGGDILVNMDADNYSCPGFAWWIVEQLITDLELFFLWVFAKSVIGRARQGLAGRIVLSRNAFLKVGGYDERYIEWAPEDEDLKVRLRRIGCEGIRIEDRFLYVIPHKDGLRFREYPHAKPTPEQEEIALTRVRESKDTVVNFGNYGCGTVYENFSETPIHLGPLPTRIFGIGMMKTATTSLDRALKILGFDSAHFKNPLWARNVWEEVLKFGRSPTLEKSYAISDNPIPLLYKQLDKAYPGSKFILTVRNERDWVRSVRDHWNPDLNPFRWEWDTDAFSHRLHQEVYGRKTFDAETFLRRYRQHNTEVFKYFKGRPDDLLILNADLPDYRKWDRLCVFLGCRHPGVPYPRAFATPRVI